MCSGSQPWAKITSWCHFLNSTQSFKCLESNIVEHLVVYWQKYLKLFNWKPPKCRKDIDCLSAEVIKSLRLLQWDEKENLKTMFNCVAKLGKITVEDGILESRR